MSKLLAAILIFCLKRLSFLKLLHDTLGDAVSEGRHGCFQYLGRDGVDLISKALLAAGPGEHLRDRLSEGIGGRRRRLRGGGRLDFVPGQRRRLGTLAASGVLPTV
jgi:hypothetical protein